MDRVRVADIGEGVLAQDEEIGEFADFERADILGVAERFRSVDGGGAQELPAIPDQPPGYQ